jgi:hypothetical protein
MREIERIQGVWRLVRYEEKSEQRSPHVLQQMARLLVHSFQIAPRWDGVWAAVCYGDCPAQDVFSESLFSLKRLLGGAEPLRGQRFRLLSGGVLTIRAGVVYNTIDFHLYPGQSLLVQDNRDSTVRGIYRFDGVRLALSLANFGSVRHPTTFDTTIDAGQSHGVYVREHSLATLHSPIGSDHDRSNST